MSYVRKQKYLSSSSSNTALPEFTMPVKGTGWTGERVPVTSSSAAKQARMPAVVEITAACPACGSRTATTRTSRVDPLASMKMEDGSFVRGVRFSYRQCSRCPQRYVVRSPIGE